MQTEPQTVTILRGRQREALAALKKLAKRASRYGNAPISFELGEPRLVTSQVKDWDGEFRVVRKSVVDVTLKGEAPRIGDHEFLARIEFTTDGYYVDSSPHASQPVERRFLEDADRRCEHCNKRRERKDVFVILDRETGRQMQVGRTCLRDYLGMDDPAQIARIFAFYREFREEGGRFGGFDDYCQSTEGLLALCSVAVRLFGWCSSGQAYADESLTPTKAYVTLGLSDRSKLRDIERPTYDKIREALREEDFELARKTITWARDESTQADSDYMHNLKTALAGDVITDRKRLGLVVSAVPAYNRAMEIATRRTKERQQAQASRHVGEIKERLRGLEIEMIASIYIGAGQFGDVVLNKFKDLDGNVFVWFTSRGMELERGERATIDATVKDHDVRDGVCQTKLTRVTVK